MTLVIEDGAMVESLYNSVTFCAGLKQRVDVTVIAATNRPDKIDPALLRPGSNKALHVECLHRFLI